MISQLDRQQAELADDIQDQFFRLGVSSVQDPCSGLMTDTSNVVTDRPLVDIYDDHDRGTYDARSVLARLKELDCTQVSLNDNHTNIWQLIAPYEV